MVTKILRLLEALMPRSLTLKRWLATAYLERAKKAPQLSLRQAQSQKAIEYLKPLVAEREAPLWRERQVLFSLAEANLLWGDVESARRYAESVVATYPEETSAEAGDPFEAKELLKAWDFLRDAHLMLGRIALDRGNIDGAGHHLVEAARAPSTPALESFGPDVTLANALLTMGHPAYVLSYLSELGRHWRRGRDKAEEWIATIEAGRTPAGPGWRPRRWQGDADVD